MPGLIFCNQAGSPVDVNHFRGRIWNPALKLAALPHHRIHDLRHTYATIRIARGDDIAEVSAQLGHYNPMFTAKQYWHWKPSDRGRQQLNALAEMVLGPGEG